MSGYCQAKKDYETLSGIKELYDCLPVEENFWDLMRNPSRRLAAELYESAILLWFAEHGVIPGSEEIADRRLIPTPPTEDKPT